jgi:hypothetical protein
VLAQDGKGGRRRGLRAVAVSFISQLLKGGRAWSLRWTLEKIYVLHDRNMIFNGNISWISLTIKNMLTLFFGNLFGLGLTFPSHHLLWHNSSAYSRYMYLRVCTAGRSAGISGHDLQRQHFMGYILQLNIFWLYSSVICSDLASPFNCTTYFDITLPRTRDTCIWEFVPPGGPPASQDIMIYNGNITWDISYK